MTFPVRHLHQVGCQWLRAMSRPLELQKRSFSPYAIDSPEVDLSTLRTQNRGSFASSSYENVREPSHSAGRSTFGSPNGPSYLNGGYDHFPEATSPSHTYEDASKLAEKVLNSTGKRSKRNVLYEPSGPLHGEQGAARAKADEEYDTGYVVKDSCLGRLILFLILIVSAIALLLVVLIILGKLGPSCSCASTGMCPVCVCVCVCCGGSRGGSGG